MKKKNKFPIFTFLLSITLLTLGFYFELIANKERILKKGVSNVFENIIEVVDMFEFDTGLSNNYKKEADIKITSNSFTNNYLTEGNNIIKNENLTLNLGNIFRNLNETNTEVTIINDLKNKKRFIHLQSNLQETNLLELKNLTENSTNYYYVNGFLNTYVNNGNDNYFESFDEKTTVIDNMKYLSNFIIESITNNINNTDYKITEEKLNINNKEKKYKKISILIDKKKADEINKNVVKSIKKDDRSSKIILSTNKEIDNLKTNIFPKNTNLILNTYVENYTYKIKKYEIIYNNSKTKENITVTYECKNKNEGIGEIIINNEKYKYEYVSREKSKEITIYTEEQKLGTISIEKTKTGILFDLSIINDNKEISINYIMNLLNLKKGKSYNQEQQLTIRTEVNNEPLNFDITINTKVNNKVKIEEDTSSSIIEKTLTDEDRARLNNIFLDVITKLNS